MSTVLFSFAKGPYTKLLDLSELTFADYAKAQGWDFVCDRDFEHARPASWWKIRTLLELLQRYDSAVYVDSDAMIVRNDLNILDAAPWFEKSIWMCKHRVSHGPQLLPNGGVLVVHKEPRAVEFLERVWAQEDWVTHPWWEQAAILHLLGYKVGPGGAIPDEPTEHTEWTSLFGWLGTEWNSMPVHDPHPDPVIIHFSGMPFADRLQGMGELDV